jgi:hypothetical protein
MRAQVIHLYTGRPVTRMGLERSVVWDDINGDGVVEAVRLSTLPTAGQSSEDQVPFPLHAPPHAGWGHSLARIHVFWLGAVLGAGPVGGAAAGGPVQCVHLRAEAAGLPRAPHIQPQAQVPRRYVHCPPPHFPVITTRGMTCLLVLCSGVLRATNPISIARPRTWAEPNGHKDMVRAVPNGVHRGERGL